VHSNGVFLISLIEKPRKGTMEQLDLVLTIIYLNNEKGRKLNAKGIKEIAESLGVLLDTQVIRDMIDAGLLNEDCTLTPMGKKVALKAVKRIEKEVKRGPLGAMKWFNFKLRAVPDNIKPDWLNPQ